MDAIEAKNSRARVLAAVDHDQARLDAIVARLESSNDHTERADLVTELIKTASRLEDVKSRAVYPALVGMLGADDPSLAVAQRDHARLRELMAEMRAVTRHTLPRDVHFPDPDGIDRRIDELCLAVKAHVEQEDKELFGALDELDPNQAADLDGAVAAAAKDAVEHPRPPKSRLGRWLADWESRWDHVFEDTPTGNHPGRDQLPPQDPVDSA